MKPSRSLDKALSAAIQSDLDAVQGARHMARKVLALSYRMPLFIRFGDRGFTYSISCWHGAV